MGYIFVILYIYNMYSAMYVLWVCIYIWVGNIFVLASYCWDCDGLVLLVHPLSSKGFPGACRWGFWLYLARHGRYIVNSCMEKGCYFVEQSDKKTHSCNMMYVMTWTVLRLSIGECVGLFYTRCIPLHRAAPILLPSARLATAVWVQGCLLAC